MTRWKEAKEYWLRFIAGGGDVMATSVTSLSRLLPVSEGIFDSTIALSIVGREHLARYRIVATVEAQKESLPSLDDIGRNQEYCSLKQI